MTRADHHHPQCLARLTTDDNCTCSWRTHPELPEEKRWNKTVAGLLASEATEPEARVNVTIRLSKPGIRAVDKMAEDNDRTRSDMIRILISEAVKARAKR